MKKTPTLLSEYISEKFLNYINLKHTVVMKINNSILENTDKHFK